MHELPQKRLAVEEELQKHAIRRGWLWWLRWENLSFMEPILEGFLRATGLYARGYRNVLNPRLCRQEWVFERLPEAFDGFRILWISDLHADRIDGLVEKVLAMAEPLDYDVAFLGGDFCFDHAMTDLAGVQVRQIAEALCRKSPVYAVFGNHDYSPLAQLFLESGVTLLLNEHVPLERNGQTLRLIGVDDCHYFKADDLDAAMQGVDGQEFKILLSHSPELYAEAAGRGIDLFLAGHTHGGQICLPGGTALVYSAAAPRKCIRGPWTHKEMAGFTSGGAGASGVAVRFNCPGEFNLFTLRKN